MTTVAISTFAAVGNLAEGRRCSVPLINGLNSRTSNHETLAAKNTLPIFQICNSFSGISSSLYQAKNYGSYVASKIPEVECDMCLKEFCALKNCMKNVSLLEYGSLLFGGKATYTRVFPDPGERCGHKWEYDLLYCFFSYHANSLKSGVPSIANWCAKLQIYSWLSNSPSKMESYIRSSCVVLSVYVLMSCAAWVQLEEKFLQQASAWVQGSDSEFWRSGRFSVNIGRQLAIHNDGTIHIPSSGAFPRFSLKMRDHLVFSNVFSQHFMYLNVNFEDNFSF
ncbi:hypothetical protein Cgig2_011331 [Carnegiea gigantea]|uniref:Uncharacterized protein n=1 Tax=Carnegiea gigantea TaxID=171969 RepID=A0A9Q1QHY4_9CARY|nr:hypothetical protein Cgig2_011331 [Carnegiea gigantea]